MDGSSKIDIAAAAKLYNERLKKFGCDIKTVGWGRKEDQILRFDILFRELNPKGKRILDVGCGLGDLVPYLDNVTNGDFHYHGIDVADNLVYEAERKYGAEHRIFSVGDIFSLELLEVDIAILSGALSFKVDGIESYAYQTMARMYQLSQEASCLNFLSKYVDFETDKNQHYHPEIIFSKAKNISKRVNLYHDYPLFEFTIQIIKAN